jgi:hypothetical protein
LFTAIHTFEDDAEPVLRSMGLSGSIMQDICRRGLAQYLTATPFHPVNAPGTFMYHGLVHAMRELLVPVGWEFAEESLSFTFNSESSIALVVSSGNVHAGDRTQGPWFKYPKGPTTQAAIVGNAIQLGLFDGVPGFAEFVLPSTPKRVDFDTFKTWWLLHHVDLSKGEMRAELSLPVGVSSRGEVSHWEIRIILEPIPFDEEPEADRIDNRGDGPDFEVEVRKKA